MIKKANDHDDTFIWQNTYDEDSPNSEPAILVQSFSDIITICQEGREILINKNKKNVNEIITALKSALDAKA